MTKNSADPSREIGLQMSLAQKPVAYAPEAVLDIYQLAEWLQISKRSAERLHIPCFYLGTRTRRFLGSTVLEYLKKREAA